VDPKTGPEEDDKGTLHKVIDTTLSADYPTDSLSLIPLRQIFEKKVATIAMPVAMKILDNRRAVTVRRVLCSSFKRGKIQIKVQG
jgi:hypothetical protein